MDPLFIAFSLIGVFAAFVLGLTIWSVVSLSQISRAYQADDNDDLDDMPEVKPLPLWKVR